MFKKFPILARASLFVFLPLLVLAYTTVQTLKSSVLIYSGEVQLSGLDSEVEVRFDNFGTPSVIAPTDAQAYFAQGYLHASERMWQMELQRRLVDGRVSEIFGVSGIGSDVWMRTLGLRQAASTALGSLSDDSRLALLSYANGVNAWLESTPSLSPEFLFFGVEPEPWQVLDSLAWQKVFALNLSQNLYDEIDRLQALDLLSVEDFKLFYPYDTNVDILIQSKANKVARAANNAAIQMTQTQSKVDSKTAHQFNDFNDVRRLMQQDWGISQRFAGSNAWVVSGEHTASGKPILANDPHLGVQLPSLWYALTLKGDKLDTRGMSLVGLPGVILGRNQHIAWGATALMGDQQDLFVIDIPKGENMVYLTDAGKQPITVREEEIKIRRQSPKALYSDIKPLTFQVRTTALGPIVSDVLRSKGQTMVLRWSALDAQDQTFESFYSMQYAKNWIEFKDSVAKLKSPGLHFLYADNAGNIGAQVGGHIPIRGAGDGTFPQSAFTVAEHWQGYIAFEQLPQVYNPEAGFLVSANNEIEGAQDLDISHEWAPMRRNIRITELLTKKIASQQPLDSASMTSIQLDQFDAAAFGILPALKNELLQKELLEIIPQEKRQMAQAALMQINQWTGYFKSDSAGATVYHYWFNALKKEVFNNDLASPWLPYGDKEIRNVLTAKIDDERIMDLLNGKGDKRWCKTYFDHVVACEQELYDAFETMLDSLKKHTRSTDPQDWHWGQLHHVRFVHQPFGQMKMFAGLFVEEQPVGGSTHTVNVANATKAEGGGFNQGFGSVFRQIFDLGKTDGDSYILASGQSGHMMSPHYKDMILPFIQGKMLPFIDITDEQANAQVSVLKLKPKSTSQ